MLKLKNISWLLLCAALLYIIFLHECRSPVEPEIIITHHDTTIYDTITDTIRIKEFYPKEVILPSDTFFKYHEVDTPYILRDYFSKIFMDDTLKNDSSAFLRIQDTIYMNRLKYRKLIFKNNRPTEIKYETTIINPPKNILYIGGALGFCENNFNVSAGLFLKTKKDYLYGIYYSPVRKEYGSQIFIPVRLKKNKQ